MLDCAARKAIPRYADGVEEVKLSHDVPTEDTTKGEDDEEAGSEYDDDGDGDLDEESVSGTAGLVHNRCCVVELHVCFTEIPQGSSRSGRGGHKRRYPKLKAGGSKRGKVSYND